MRGDRQRSRPRSRSGATPGCVGGGPPALDARCLRARAPWELQPRAGGAGGDGRPLPRVSAGRRRERQAGRVAAVRSAQRSRVSLPGRGGRDLDAAARRAVRRATAQALFMRPAGRPGRRQRPPGAGAADHREAGPGRFFPAAPRHAGAGPGGRRRGAGAGHRQVAVTTGAWARLQRLLDRLLPDRPLAHRPDRQRAADRALSKRGADGAAGHRPGFSPRYPRGSDPPRARALRARPFGAGRGLPDVSGAGGDSGAGQGAGPAAGRDRAGRAR